MYYYITVNGTVGTVIMLTCSQILKPMMLRRLKEDVEKNLAPKEETIIEVELKIGRAHV